MEKIENIFTENIFWKVGLKKLGPSKTAEKFWKKLKICNNLVKQKRSHEKFVWIIEISKKEAGTPDI